MYYIVYKTINILNNRYYIGIHKQRTLAFDGYFGSGKLIKQALKKHGKENFFRETLFVFDNLISCKEKEQELVNDSLLEDSLSYNMCIGGGSPPDRKLWKSEWEIHWRETVPKKTSERMKINNPSSRAAGKNHWARDTQMVKDKEGNIFRASNNDPRFETGEIFPMNKNKVTVRDKKGNTFSVFIDDHRYLSGELVSVNKGIKNRKMSEKGKRKKFKICPICNKNIFKPKFDKHIEKCSKPPKMKKIMCPNCQNEIASNHIKRHSQKCLTNEGDE